MQGKTSDNFTITETTKKPDEKASSENHFLGLVLKISLILLAICVIISAFLFLVLKPSDGRTNILLLGIAGANHAGSDLTDSIFFISAENSTGKTTVLAVPRDIWVTPLRTKLNSVYHYQGPEKSKETISQVVGQPINYIMVVDFEIFKKTIDVLGRIEVDVERTFDDYKYPIAGKENDPCNGDPEYKCRYEHVHFEAGKQTMDGETALKYVRSRNSVGEEGTDFARSQRQQRVILAIKDKVLQLNFMANPQRAIDLSRIAFENIKTDIPQDKYFNLFKTAIRFRTKNLKMGILNGDFLVSNKNSSQYDYQWVLVPRSGNWEEVHSFVSSLISGF